MQLTAFSKDKQSPRTAEPLAFKSMYMNDLSLFPHKPVLSWGGRVAVVKRAHVKQLEINPEALLSDVLASEEKLLSNSPK